MFVISMYVVMCCQPKLFSDSCLLRLVVNYCSVVCGLIVSLVLRGELLTLSDAATNSAKTLKVMIIIF